MEDNLNFNRVISLEDFEDKSLRPYLFANAKHELKRFGIGEPAFCPDSKHWETAMALYSFERHGLLKAGKLFAGIRAGTEWLTEYLANIGAIAFPVDRYLEATCWQDVAPAGFMANKSEYLDEDTNTRNIIPVQGDARMLELPSSFFDAVYSSGSIEHFGGLESIEAAAREVARILKPGGYASISTEYFLEGPGNRPWFNNDCILFTPDLLRKHIIEPSGLVPVDQLVESPSPKTFQSRIKLVDFLTNVKTIRTFEDKARVYPNLILHHQGYLFCSVHIFLRKPLDWKASPISSKSSIFQEQIRQNRHNSMKKLQAAFSSALPQQEQISNAVSSTPHILKHRWIKAGVTLAKSYLLRKPFLKKCVIKILMMFPGLMMYLRRKSRGLS